MMANRKVREVVRIMQEECDQNRELVLAFCRTERQKLLDRKLASLTQCVVQERKHCYPMYATNGASASLDARQTPGEMQRNGSGSGSSGTYTTPKERGANGTNIAAASITGTSSSTSNNNNTTTAAAGGGGGAIPTHVNQRISMHKDDLINENVAYRSTPSARSLLESLQAPVTDESLEGWHKTTDFAAASAGSVYPISRLPEWQRDVVTVTEGDGVKGDIMDRIHRLYGETTAAQTTWTPTSQRQQQEEEHESQFSLKLPFTLMDHVSPEGSSHFPSSGARNGETATGTTTTTSSTGGGIATGRKVMSKEQVVSELRRLYGLEDVENGGNMDE